MNKNKLHNGLEMKCEKPRTTHSQTVAQNQKRWQNKLSLKFISLSDF